MSRKSHYNYENKPFYPRLKAFKSWLEKQGYAKDTVRQLTGYTGCFLDWLESKNLETGQVSYVDMLGFIKYYQNKDSIGLLNRKLGAVRKYYEWLQLLGEVGKNPATGIYLKGRKTRVPRDLLDRQALDELYENYHVTDERTQRNKVVLGLLVCQGLTVEELHKLEAGHIKLKAGKIDIPAGAKSKSRTLKLEPYQILDLQEYINTTRWQILEKIYAYNHQEPFYRPGRKPDQINRTRLDNQLFISMNGSTNIKNSIKHLIQALQQINEEVKSAAQIRQSVITEWLKVKDLRTVQYMAGHRYVSTTERYQQSNLEDLEEALNVHHPLERQ